MRSPTQEPFSSKLSMIYVVILGNNLEEITVADQKDTTCWNPGACMVRGICGSAAGILLEAKRCGVALHETLVGIQLFIVGQ